MLNANNNLTPQQSLNNITIGYPAGTTRGRTGAIMIGRNNEHIIKKIKYVVHLNQEVDWYDIGPELMKQTKKSIPNPHFDIDDDDINKTNIICLFNKSLRGFEEMLYMNTNYNMYKKSYKQLLLDFLNINENVILIIELREKIKLLVDTLQKMLNERIESFAIEEMHPSKIKLLLDDDEENDLSSCLKDYTEKFDVKMLQIISHGWEFEYG